MRKIFICTLALLLTLAATGCSGSGAGTADTTAPVDTTAAPVTTAAPETEPPITTALAESMTGYYTCGDVTLELFTLGGVWYGEMSRPADGGTAYWGIMVEPVNPGDFEQVGLSETRVRINQFSAEELGGSLIGDPAAYTLAVTKDGLDFCDHTTGSALIEGNDVDLSFIRTDAPKPEASSLAFDAAAVKEAGLVGMWTSKFSDGKADYDVTLCFRENGRMFCRIEVTGQVPNIWMGDYALPAADSGLSSGTVLCNVTRKGANKMVWPVRVVAVVKGERLILNGVRDMTGASLLNLAANLSPVEDTAVIPTLG